MIYTSIQIRDILRHEEEENSLVSRELLDKTLAWKVLFDSFPDIEFHLEGKSSTTDFIKFLDNNKSAIEQTVMAAQRRKHKSGPTPKPAAQLRKNLVGIYLTDMELFDIAIRAGSNIPVNKPGGDTTARRKIADFIRRSAAGSLPPTVPQLNYIAWCELANALNNLNQIARKLNSGMQINDFDSRNIAEIKIIITALRPKLLLREI